MKKLFAILALSFVSLAGMQAQSVTVDRLEAQRAGQAASGEFVENGSPADESIKVFIPNAFTPNGDGVNDFFYIPNSNLRDVDVTVFDRWGNEVFHSINTNFRWDGNFNGKATPSGVYVFVFQGTNPEGHKVRRSGTLSLVR